MITARYIYVTLFSSLILFFGCSSNQEIDIPEHLEDLENLKVYSADVEPSHRINLKNVQIFGDTDDVLIGELRSVAVDDSGRVFIADAQKKVIHVFEPGGRFIAQLGGEGRGPGEFSEIKSLQIRKDLLYVYDPSQYKISIFALDTLSVANTISLARNRGKYQELAKAYPWIHKIYVRNNDTYLAQFILDSSKPTKEWQNIETNGLIYLLDSTGKIASDKLIDFKEDTRVLFEVLLVPLKDFFGNAHTVLSSDNTIYQTEPDHFLIKIYNPDGTYRHAFYYPHKKINITQETAVEAEVPDLFIKNMKNINLPQTWPVLTDMKIDDQDRLWVATTVKDMEVYQWWVLNPNGKLTARFNWPRSKSIQVIKNGKLYTLEEDEGGMESIVRYGIEME